MTIFMVQLIINGVSEGDMMLRVCIAVVQSRHFSLWTNQHTSAVTVYHCPVRESVFHDPTIRLCDIFWFSKLSQQTSSSLELLDGFGRRTVYQFL